jgi:hypothetical protein
MLVEFKYLYLKVLQQVISVSQFDLNSLDVKKKLN